MQKCTQRIASEKLFPSLRRELVHARCQMLAHVLQHVDQIIVQIDLVQLACHQQTLHDAHLPRSHFSPAEQPVAASHGNGAQRPFQRIRVDVHVRIVQVQQQTGPALAQHVRFCSRISVSTRHCAPICSRVSSTRAGSISRAFMNIRFKSVTHSHSKPVTRSHLSFVATFSHESRHPRTHRP